MKIRHVYTVIREIEVEPCYLEGLKNAFSNIVEEPLEYLYLGATSNEIITAIMEEECQPSPGCKATYWKRIA